MHFFVLIKTRILHFYPETSFSPSLVRKKIVNNRHTSIAFASLNDDEFKRLSASLKKSMKTIKKYLELCEFNRFDCELDGRHR